jgi:hypothetical protein
MHVFVSMRKKKKGKYNSFRENKKTILNNALILSDAAKMKKSSLDVNEWFVLINRVPPIFLWTEIPG